MMPTIHTRIEGPRGCGRRKQGGTYLVSDGPGRLCGRIPFPLENCPTCNHGIKLIRSWTWITIKPILDSLPDCIYSRSTGSAPCWSCPLHLVSGRVGLLTVGSRFYAMPADFMAEVEKMGLSRRIPAVPKDFVLGSTWVMLAHRQAIARPCLSGRDRHDALELSFGQMVEADMEKVMGPIGYKAQEMPSTEFDPSVPVDPICCRFCQLPMNEWRGPGVFYIFQPQRIEYVVKDDDPVDKLERLDKRGITLVKIEPLDDDSQLSLGQGGEARA